MKEQISEVDFDVLLDQPEKEEVIFDKDFKLIEDVELSLTAVLGRANISVKELFSLSSGSTLELDCGIEEPVKIYSKDKLIAIGNIVTVGDSFGIKIVEVS